MLLEAIVAPTPMKQFFSIFVPAPIIDPPPIKKLCSKLKLKYSCTAFDLKSLIFLDKELNVPFFKIASGEIHSIDMLEYISKSNKPVILSSGMSTFNDVKQSLKILQKHKKKNIT